ncbi:MAG: hypothetical protein ACLFRV_03415 [Acidimicrobiales bacterium]
MALRAALLVTVLILAGCGDDTDSASDTTTTTGATTSTSSSSTTTSTSSSTTTTTDPDACPDDAPIPSGVTDVTEATVAYDGDGDGDPDTLSVYPHDGMWWLHVEWAAGGTAAVTIDSASGMGARPLGGHDLDDDGADEAWVAISGPASGSIVGIYRSDGCGLTPVLDEESGMAFEFPVTASVGAISGATCDGLADLDLFSGELEAPDTGEYLISQSPYSYDGVELTAEFGDSGSADSDDIGQYSSLDCGSLAGAL